MTTATANPNRTSEDLQHAYGSGSQVPFDSVHDPGSYVCSWSGHLMRVPPDSAAAGHSPKLNLVGLDALFVTKISDDPYIPVTKARMIAANWDVAVNF